MSAPTPNIPSLRNAPQSFAPAKAFTYEGIPKLLQLLPQLRGVPGFYYLQVAVVNARRAEDEGWRPVAATAIYTITGPKGSCDVSLYCFGDRIPSGNYQASKRECYVDWEVLRVTGLTNGNDAVEQFEPEEEVAVTEEPRAEDIFDEVAVVHEPVEEGGEDAEGTI